MSGELYELHTGGSEFWILGNQEEANAKFKYGAENEFPLKMGPQNKISLPKRKSVSLNIAK